MKGFVVNLIDANVHIKIKNPFQNILKVIKQISNVKNVERDVYLDMNLDNIY